MYLETEKYIVSTERDALWKYLEQNLPFPKSSHILSFDPFLDYNHLLSIGGRLKHTNIPLPEKRPLLIPGKHHIAKLISQVDEDIQHQGRHMTEGALRSAGFRVTGAKRLIALHVVNHGDLPPD